MQPLEYSTNPKVENKITNILRKGGIRIYRKCRDLLHISSCIYLSDKVSPTLRAHNNGFKKATVTQWGTG